VTQHLGPPVLNARAGLCVGQVQESKVGWRPGGVGRVRSALSGWKVAGRHSGGVGRCGRGLGRRLSGGSGAPRMSCSQLGPVVASVRRCSVPAGVRRAPVPSCHTALQGLGDRTGLQDLARFVDGIVVAVERGTRSRRSCGPRRRTSGRRDAGPSWRRAVERRSPGWSGASSTTGSRQRSRWPAASRPLPASRQSPEDRPAAARAYRRVVVTVDAPPSPCSDRWPLMRRWRQWRQTRT
jgi:hypothetical protein